MPGLIESQMQIKSIILSRDDIYSNEEITAIYTAGQKEIYPRIDLASIAAEVYADTFTHRDKFIHPEDEVARLQDKLIIGRLFNTVIAKRPVSSPRPKNYGTEKKQLHAIQDNQGVVQKLKIWSQCINDCWIFGGICSYRKFELCSSMEASMTPSHAGIKQTVTSTEIAALKVSGYSRSIECGKIMFTPPTPGSFALLSFEDFVRKRKGVSQDDIWVYLRGQYGS
jgi:hypothetical protein